jgi:hypothetical protein
MIHFSLTNTPQLFYHEINHILRQLLGVEILVGTQIEYDAIDRAEVVVCINDLLTATNGC